MTTVPNMADVYDVFVVRYFYPKFLDGLPVS